MTLSSHIVNAKESFLRGDCTLLLERAQTVTEWNCFSADPEKGLVVWRGDQATHSLLVSQSAIQSKALILHPVTLREGRKKTLKLARSVHEASIRARLDAS